MTPPFPGLLGPLLRLAPVIAARRGRGAPPDVEGELARLSAQVEDARARTGILLGSDGPGPSGREPAAERRLIAAERELMLCLARRARLLEQHAAGSTARSGAGGAGAGSETP